MDSMTTMHKTKVPDLEMLISALIEARQHCDDNFIVVFDGWEEDNMIEPDKFQVLLNALTDSRCKIFLTSRSDLEVLAEVAKVARTKIISLPGLSKGQQPHLDDVVSFIQGLMLASLGGTEVTPEIEHLSEWVVQRSNGV